MQVPASKSVLSRALLLASFTEGDTMLLCGGHAEDTEALLGCLRTLGIMVEEHEDGLLVHGVQEIPNRSAVLNVGSAGTAARFLTAILAFRGGRYEMHASAQMQKRPMEIITPLRELGVAFTFLEEENRFPFLMESDGILRSTVQVDTDTSTQYASGLMLAAAVGNDPFTLTLTGSRTDGSYIKTTQTVLKKFGAECIRTENAIQIAPVECAPREFCVEPDISGACYFYALSLLCGAKVLVKDVQGDCSQADIRFLQLLSERGVRITQLPDGILADGSGVTSFEGFDLNMQDFSDQVLTVAALAPFASSPTTIRGIGHIRRQECDRIAAIVSNLTALGVPCSSTEDSVFIAPAPVSGGTIQTFEDHRVAMAFSLIGLRTGNISIENPNCCRKTFPNYFRLLDTLTE